MDSRPIKSETDFRTALQEIESLMRAEPGTPAGERLDVMVTLVEAYERPHSPIGGATDPGPAHPIPARQCFASATMRSIHASRTPETTSIPWIPTFHASSELL